MFTKTIASLLQTHQLSELPTPASEVPGTRRPKLHVAQPGEASVGCLCVRVCVSDNSGGLDWFV